MPLITQQPETDLSLVTKFTFTLFNPKVTLY